MRPDRRFCAWCPEYATHLEGGVDLCDLCYEAWQKWEVLKPGEVMEMLLEKAPKGPRENIRDKC